MTKLRTSCVVAVLAAAVLAGTADAKITDPRKCSTGTPGGPDHHAYWCAHNAAVAVVRTTLAKKYHVAHWYSPTFCDQTPSLLTWKCQSLPGGKMLLVTVTWRATSTGWRVRTSTATAP